MSLEGKSILILLGGTYHDFDGFARVMQPFFQDKGCKVETTYELEQLRQLDKLGIDLVLMYTCLTRQPEAPSSSPEKLTDAQVDGLVRWVREGGGLLAAHAATAIGDSDPALGRLMGGVFLSHPPETMFTVYPLSGAHPITENVPAFGVRDELYFQQYDPHVSIHMIALHEEKAYPLVWSRTEGKGRVAHIALGHSKEVWNHPFYQQLMLQSARWLVEG